MGWWMCRTATTSGFNIAAEPVTTPVFEPPQQYWDDSEVSERGDSELRSSCARSLRDLDLAASTHCSSNLTVAVAVLVTIDCLNH
jgi:hypothetical protein